VVVKDHLERLVLAQPTEVMKGCAAREYLQARILQSLQDSGAFMSWAFVGGTALRFLFDALEQTGWTAAPLTPRTWRRALASRLDAFDWRAAREDVKPFLERQADAALLTLENVRKLLGAKTAM
jgi:hypothetical protein